MRHPNSLSNLFGVIGSSGGGVPFTNRSSSARNAAYSHGRKRVPVNVHQARISELLIGSQPLNP